MDDDSNKKEFDSDLFNYNMLKQILGHLSAIYCVCFDRTGQCIITGADDFLIKIWSAFNGQLLATLRGHEKEISDIDINFENTFIASGSCDKTVRIWSLKTTECLKELKYNLGNVTSVQFSPYCQGTTRWLVSTCDEGVLAFWKWNSENQEFNDRPKIFIEKSRKKYGITSISFSNGGLFLAAGSKDHAIRVYCFENGDPIKICELESHTNLVDSIQYANKSARFLSGSKDGTAKIWSFESQQWKNILIDGSKTLYIKDICKRYSVTMVAWNCDDSLVITAQNNFIIKIWNSTDAQLIHELKGHNDEIFVLEAHPKDPRLLLSAGHDGHVILWNILTGKLIKKFYNRIENEGHGCLFDAKWSSTLDMFALADSEGNLTIFGFGNDDNFRKIPNQLFFHTDYRPLMRDSNNYVLDEQTQTPPHLMPPPFLIDADGNPYDAELQRLVPGRENFTDDQLIPQIITNENGTIKLICDKELESLLWSRDLIKPLDENLLNQSEITRIQNFFNESTLYKKELENILNDKSMNIVFAENSIDSNNNEITILTQKKEILKRSDSNMFEIIEKNLKIKPIIKVVYIQEDTQFSSYDSSSEHSNWSEEENTSKSPNKRHKKINHNKDINSNYHRLNNIEDNRNFSSPYCNLATKTRNLKSPKKNIKTHKKRGRPPLNSATKAPSKIDRPVSFECPIEHRPLEWLTSTKPKKSPYVPQIGDEVVYFRQGHELYVQTVRDYKIYEIDEKKLPIKNKSVRVQEFCKVIQINIEIKPPRLVCLKLGVIDRRSGRLTGIQFTVKYHNTPGVADFVILRQFYEKAIERNWMPKDRFRCIIDDFWNIGVIDTKKPLQEEYPDSQFQCYTVELENNVLSEDWSPWDFEPLPEFLVNNEISTLLSKKNIISSDETESLMYIPNNDDWPNSDRDAECERILNGLEKISELTIAEPFSFINNYIPIDSDEFSSYDIIISYPIDLNTIKQRLKNHFYRRLAAIEWDIKKIEENVISFYNSNHSFFEMSKILTKILLEFIYDKECTNPSKIIENWSLNN